jgi:plastocyanin
MKSKLIILLLSLFSFQAYAAPGADIGKVGEAKDVQKVIRVQMYDNYFKPTSYKIKAGQTVKFIVENKGAWSTK